jgi:protein-L-isoaspartate(D-aspartate) O-methyltransferase
MALATAKLAEAPDRHVRDRAVMVSRHLQARGVSDPLVLAAMGKVPREAFVPESLTEFAYEDAPLPIEAGQTISQPYIVARMIELAEVRPGDRVLEVGAGSGYAAAVVSRIASKVYAIERHEELADHARTRLERLGYDNAEIICGDGTKGLPDKAPFNAIIVSAGGPKVPEPLKQQLAIGGRLVVPVGRDVHQTLLLVRRVDEDIFEEEDHGAVAFVPLIGAEGWVEPEETKHETVIDAESSGFAHGLLMPAQRAKAIRTRLSHLIAEAAEPFGDLDELARLAERFAHKRVVLLGEATHGTAEFYDARAAITAMLVAKHGFNIVAVEADWPDAAVFDAYVRGLPRPKVPKAAFTRFPHWMWRNGEVATFLNRLKAINEEIGDPDRKCGFYGLDVYSLGASIEAVLAYLDKIDPEAAAIARERYGCLTPWRADPVRYGRMALSRGYAVCEKPVAEALLDVLKKRLDYLFKDGEAFFDAEQNARIVAAADEYYRRLCDLFVEPALRSAYFDARAVFHRGPDLLRVGAQLLSARRFTKWARSGASTHVLARAAGEGRVDRLRHRLRHGRRGFRLERPHGDQARAPGARRFLRRPLARGEHPGVLPRDGSWPKGAHPRRACRAAARARYRRDLPARDRAPVTLFPGRIVAPIRCLDLVYRDRGRGG